MYYYLVAPTTVVRSNESAFTYHSKQQVSIGTIASISVGKKKLVGIIISEVKKPPFTTKEIEQLIVQKPVPPQLISLAQWMSDYYAAHLAVVFQTLLPAGLQKQRRQNSTTNDRAHRLRTNIVLNAQQRSAIAAISERPSGTLLLHGVPGSGKTQVYIEAAKREMAAGRSSIVLVPEIALTPQLVAEFDNHFGHTVLTHSRMTEAERHRAWLTALNTDEPLIIIGPRSALFMPVPNLGLIVLDEAHEPSYKQDQSPRYSALRTASILAKLHPHAKLVLGSATPAIYDYYLARHTHSPIIQLTKPAVDTSPPVVQLVDSRRQDNFREHRFVSDPLVQAMRQALHDHQQILLFHNRRGTAPTTLCSSCGWSSLCPACFVPTTLHADQQKLLCHLCGHAQNIPPNCPECSNPNVVFRGIGTKMIESEIHKLFPKATVARFDADNTTDQTLDQRYQEIYDGHIDIMIGTQVLAKGLDVPNLSVVGVMQADNGLHLPDYQAEERVFQLLYQVAGRVGRSKYPGKVIVQTYLPDSPVIQLALARDYDAFYQQQIRERRRSSFPPFIYLLKLTTSYKTELGAIRAARKMAQQLKSDHPHLEVLGPTPAFYERLYGKYRWQLLIKGSKRAELAAIAAKIPTGWHIDLDTANLL
jgi:primosomal protein N' (replication factor Y) (superfamily II helicase)